MSSSQVSEVSDLVGSEGSNKPNSTASLALAGSDINFSNSEGLLLNLKRTSAGKSSNIYNRPTSFAPHDFPDGLTEQHHAESCDINVTNKFIFLFGFPILNLFNFSIIGLNNATRIFSNTITYHRQRKTTFGTFVPGRHIKKETNKKHKPWFDAECREARQKFR
jgi:hypothetical protein